MMVPRSSSQSLRLQIFTSFQWRFMDQFAGSLLTTSWHVCHLQAKRNCEGSRQGVVFQRVAVAASVLRMITEGLALGHNASWSHREICSGRKTFWPVEKLAELADGPALSHVRWQGQAICFVSSINPKRFSVRNFSLTVLSGANNK
jgi:hypothetical protein